MAADDLDGDDTDPEFPDLGRALASSPPLSTDQISALLRSLDGAEAESARSRLIEGCLWLVAEAADARLGSGISRDDLFQEGTTALLAVVHGLDPSTPLSGAAFVESVRQSAAGVIGALIAGEEEAKKEDQRWAQDAEALFLAQAALTAESGSSPSDAELSAHLGWELGRVEQIRVAVAEASDQHDLELLDAIGEVEE